MIIIGNKPYKNIDISDILDKFDVNIRFNFGLPGFNNGNKKYMQVVNLHVHDNLNKQNLSPYKLKLNQEYMSNMLDELNIKNYPGGIILLEHNRMPIYNKYLKNNKCPFIFSKMPRMGPHGIMSTVIQDIKPFVSHFSLDREDNTSHLYLNTDNHKQSKICHNPEDEFKILKWLHDNDKIDITLSLLLDTNIPTLECSIVKPKFESVVMILNKFKKCVLNNFEIDYYHLYQLINHLNRMNKTQNQILINRKDNKTIIEYK
jgi:hypothetical protein